MNLGHNQNLTTGLRFTCMQLLQLCRDAATKKLVQKVRLVANARSVLLCGESGVGKEVVAKALHEEGDRKTKPMIIVHCGTSNEDLMASALLGHERGAYTGATETRLGAFEKGYKGTVYLDEVARLQPKVQGMLLRALEGESICRLGSHNLIEIDFRLIAATNRDLAKMVREGEFARDLYYRLNAVPLLVPPLRDRQEDVIRLARLFADQSGKTLEPNAEKLFEGRSWPGNIRELRNVIERAALFSEDSPTINATHVEFDDAFNFDDGSESGANEPLGVVRDDGRLLELTRNLIGVAIPHAIDGRTVNNIIDEFMVRSALERTAGNKLAAAKLLGIGRQTLYNKIVRYKIAV